MRKEIIKVDLDDEHAVVAEIRVADERTGDGLSPASRGERDISAVPSHSVQSAMENAVIPTAHAIFRHLWSLPEPADEIAVEFGLTFNTKMGLIIATSEFEGNVRVSLTWKRAASNPAG